MKDRIIQPVGHLLVAGLLVAAAGCGRVVSQVLLESAAPQGEARARIVAQPALDPPRHELWLAGDGGRWRRLSSLAEDRDWGEAIVWSEAGDRVGFVVSGERLAVFEVASGESLGDVRLVPDDGTPSRCEARAVTILAGGERFSYLSCVRGASRCRGPVVATLGGGGGAGADCPEAGGPADGATG